MDGADDGGGGRCRCKCFFFFSGFVALLSFVAKVESFGEGGLI